MADSKISLFTEDSSPSGDDLLVSVNDPAGTPTNKKVTVTNLAAYLATLAQTLTNKTLTSPLFQGTVDGWINANETWTYASADAPTFVITVPSDATTKYSVGMRIKLTQTTVKYFIITAVTATTLTVYGGTDYTLIDAAISANFYSSMKSPLGFPTNPLKWTVSTTSTSDVTQNSPTNGTWYNLGSLSLSIPIGEWRVYFKGILNVNKSGGGSNYSYVALSTTNNGSTNLNLQFHNKSSTTTMDDHTTPFFLEDTLLLASKTVYYANGMEAVYTATTMSFVGTLGATMIRAVCAYL